MNLNKSAVIPILARQQEFLLAKKFAVRVSIKMLLGIFFAGLTIGLLPNDVFAADFNESPEGKLVCPTHGFNHVANCPGCGTGNTHGPVGPSPQEIERRRRYAEAKTLARQGSDAWDLGEWEKAIWLYQQAADKYPEDNKAYLENVATARKCLLRDAAKAKADELLKEKNAEWGKRNWEKVISIYQQLIELYPNNSSYRNNLAVARDNQRIDAEKALADAIEIPRSKAWGDAVDAWNRKNYPEALRLFLQAQALRNEPKLERCIQDALVQIPLAAASAAHKKKDYPEALWLYLQVQALRNDQSLEYNIKNLRDYGVVPMEPGLTDRALPPVGPSDKADALFKLRVEKAFSDQPAIGLQQLKEKSGFVFDQGRVMGLAALPDVNAPPGRLLEEATALAKAALVVPRTDSERADAPAAVKGSNRLKKIAAQLDEGIARVNHELKKRKNLQLVDKANPTDKKENQSANAAATFTTALAVELGAAAGGSKGVFKPEL